MVRPPGLTIILLRINTMNDLLGSFVIILCLALCSYHRFTILKTTISTLIVLFIVDLFSSVSTLTWLVFIAFFTILAVPSIRQSLLSTRLLAFYKRVSPEMSVTEQEAVDAGTVWWDGEIFSGAPDWDKLHAIKRPTLSEAEQAFLDGPGPLQTFPA